MNKTAIKNFAVWARRKLMDECIYKAGLLGITEKGFAEPLPQSTKDVQFFNVGLKEPYSIQGSAIKERADLVAKIREKERSFGSTLHSPNSTLTNAFQAVVEEVAYTWFNRIIAVRFMEVNGYLPTQVRVLSSETAGKNEPDIVTHALSVDLGYTPYEKDQIMKLKDENKLDELFRMLFIKQCNKLGEVLPELFEKTEDYTELLLNISFTDKDGVLYRLTHDIEEEDFKEAVEIIGWLYQFYNTEPKDETFALLKKNVKITKERIPSATQLFTPDWIVRYMIENSLGRLWVEHLQAQNENSVFKSYPSQAEYKISNENISSMLNSIKSNWKYYLYEAEQEPEVELKLAKIREEYKNINPEDIKIIDPCMGSGHILVYAFDVLQDIYNWCGYSGKDSARLIVEKNLYGLDIDDRAYQLAYFAVMMKGRKYDRRFLTSGIKPNLCAIQESNGLDSFEQGAGQLKLVDMHKQTANYLIDLFRNAKELGSILKVEQKDYDGLLAYIEKLKIDGAEDLFVSSWLNSISNVLPVLIKQANILAQKYDVVVTNPPYMGSGGMSARLSEYVQRYYPDSKSDLFAVFIEKCGELTKKNGYQAMITQHAWMFLACFEKLRGKMLLNDTINMAHLGARAFDEIGGEVVQTSAFVVRKSDVEDYLAIFARLVDYNSQQTKDDAFLAKKDLHTSQKDDFSKIPGSPIAYWASKNTVNSFVQYPKLAKYIDARIGMISGDNNRFLRFWSEVIYKKIKFGSCENSKVNLGYKWFPLQKGGGFRKWYGNLEYVVNWENNGYDLMNKNSIDGRVRSHNYNGTQIFKEGITWNSIATDRFVCRYSENGYIFDAAGPLCEVFDNKMLYYILGFLSSSAANYLLQLINPTINFTPGYLGNLPYIIKKTVVEQICIIVECNIAYSKTDWDSFETSWDFMKHPLTLYGYQNDIGLVDYKNIEKVPPLQYDDQKRIFEIVKGEKKTPNRCMIEDCFDAWSKHCNDQFNQLKNNEEELNRIFIEIYGLQDELMLEVDDKDIDASCRKADLGREIRSLISYAVGCMFGRYSLEVEGLVFAGGQWDCSKYKTFIPDKDNCIPLTDEDYFDDDIVNRFVEFVRVVYGAETLEENLDFVAAALNGRGNSSRDTIRNYFLNGFYNDHLKIYKKRPIYWLFDSGKENGFKALIYMHRYNEDTIGNLRVEYLHRMQKVYENEINHMQNTIENSSSAREIAEATKRKEKLTKQLKEAKDYDAKIAHLALSRIAIDLDDGVVVNYEKVQTGQDGKKLEILGKI